MATPTAMARGFRLPRVCVLLAGVLLAGVLLGGVLASPELPAELSASAVPFSSD
ncbi:MAG TPA: hypothetical protein VLM11_19900 [Streptosporangiaceae bacterium]|nr:hypothetical protein [Streptosporangiaceae bacterium]